MLTTTLPWKIIFCSIIIHYMSFSHAPLSLMQMVFFIILQNFIYFLPFFFFSLSIGHFRFSVTNKREVNCRIQHSFPINWKDSGWEWGLLLSIQWAGLHPVSLSTKFLQMLSAWACNSPKEPRCMNSLVWPCCAACKAALTNVMKKGGFPS